MLESRRAGMLLSRRWQRTMKPLEATADVTLRNILVAPDFSPASDSALTTALGIARHYGSKVLLAHVFRPDPYHSLSSDARQRALDDAWREAQRQMTEQLIAGRLSGLANEVVVEQGEDIWTARRYSPQECRRSKLRKD